MRKASIRWSQARCRQRYVEGYDNISLSRLSKISNVPIKTLERWSRATSSSPSWVAMRTEFEGRMREAISEKTISKASEMIADETIKIISDNYEAHKITRDYVAEIIKLRFNHLTDFLTDKGASLSSDDLATINKDHNPLTINQLSQTLDRSTRAIGEIKGIKNEENTEAFKEKTGQPGKPSKKEWYDLP